MSKRNRIKIIDNVKYALVVRAKKRELKWILARTAVIYLALLANILTSCNVEYGMTEEAQNSWEVYCAKYNVSIDHASAEEVNFFLDCYRGSMEEEKDLGLW